MRQARNRPRPATFSSRQGPSKRTQTSERVTGKTWPSRAPSTTKIWADHLVDEQPDGTCLLYIDRHIVHEVTSPQAFEGLRISGRKVHAPDKTLGRGRSQRADHRPQPAEPRPGKRRRRSPIWRRTPSCSASNITTSSTSARASATSSAPSRASRCRASRWSAATATPRRTARSARWPTASAPPRSSTCWRPRRWCRPSRRTCARSSTASCRRTSPQRTSSWPSSARSAPPAAPATRWNTPARRSARCRWKAA